MGRYGSSRVKLLTHAPPTPRVTNTSGPTQHKEAATAAITPPIKEPLPFALDSNIGCSQVLLYTTAHMRDITVIGLRGNLHHLAVGWKNMDQIDNVLDR